MLPAGSPRMRREARPGQSVGVLTDAHEGEGVPALCVSGNIDDRVIPPLHAVPDVAGDHCGRQRLGQQRQLEEAVPLGNGVSERTPGRRPMPCCTERPG